MYDLIPHVYAKDGAIYADSRQVAEMFSKRHDDVLKVVHNLLESQETAILRSGWFKSGMYYVDGQDRGYPFYEMTKDGFAFVVMGFTGAKAREFKIRYIEQFNAMEEALRSGAAQIDAAKLAEMVRQQVALALAEQMRDNRAVISYGYLTAYDVWDKYVTDIKNGPRVQSVSGKLRKFAFKVGAETRRELQGRQPRYQFSVGMVNAWLMTEGRAWIAKYTADKAKDAGPLFRMVKN